MRLHELDPPIPRAQHPHAPTTPHTHTPAHTPLPSHVPRPPTPHPPPCSAGEVLFARGGDADAFYILESGAVTCAVDYLETTVHSRAVQLPAELVPEHSER